MNITVQRDRILIKQVVNEAVSAGGIVFKYNGEEKTDRGTVVAVGPGRTTPEGVQIPIDVAVGDTVIFNIKSGIDVKLNGDDYIMLKEDDIYCVELPE